MTSYQRIKTAVDLKEPDVVPVAPYMGNYGAALAGVPVDQYCQSGRLMAQAQLAATQMVDQDVIVIQSDNYYIAEGLGTKVRHHPDSTPTFAAPAVEQIGDIDGLIVPDPRSDGRMPVFLEAIERVAEQLKGEKTIRSSGTGSFSLASHLMGTQEFLEALAELQIEPDPEAESALRRLMEITTDSLIAFSVACLEAGADMVMNGDSLASPDMISPTMYRSWVQPYETRYFEEVNPHARRQGAATVLHICGDTTPILADMANTGAMVLEIDSKVSMKTAKETVGDRVCLMGNVEPSAVLLQGSVSLVEELSRKVIQDAGDGGGLILGSGCEVPPATPRENIDAMVRVARAHHYV